MNQNIPAGDAGNTDVSSVIKRVKNHSFHPIKDGFTYDKDLNVQGVADFDDKDWLVRTLSVRDLVCANGEMSVEKMMHALNDKNPHVRQIVSMALGILGEKKAVESLKMMAAVDPDEVVRAQVVKSLGQINDPGSLEILTSAKENDESKDVRHQAALAEYAVKKGYRVTPELALAFQQLNETNFHQAEIGKTPPMFNLPDTKGNTWDLSDHLGKSPIVLVWIFADWCPVCHREFQELFELQSEFKERGIELCTLECHDIYPARVMTGQEFEPEYWFSENDFYESYTEKIWWPHLADRAGVAATQFGVQTMAFTVHAEWINRPAVTIIDEEGIVRYIYQGTFWGDRPSMQDVLDMIEADKYDYISPDRLTKNNS